MTLRMYIARYNTRSYLSLKSEKMLRVSILNGKNKNYDRDFSKILEAIASPGVNTGLDIVDGMLQPGNAFIEITRA